MSGGKGGSTSTELPQYLQSYQKELMGEAGELSDLGYLPYTGPEVAAVNPWEELAASNQAQMSTAFNMGAPEGTMASRMPDVVTSPDGSSGYSSFPVFDQAVADLQNVAPEFDQRYKSQMGLPQNRSPYEAGSAADALHQIGGVGKVEQSRFNPNAMIQLGALLSGRGAGGSGSSALQMLAGMSGKGLLENL